MSTQNEVTCLFVLIIVSIVLSFIPGKALIHYIMLVRSLQIIIHLSLMQIIVPSNINMLFQIIFPIISYDIFDTDFGEAFFAYITYDLQT